MATTEAGHHHLEVESLTAKAVANKILSTMDVDPNEVTRFEVKIECEDLDEGDTETVIESSGPAAGRIVSPMLKHTDWDSEEPRKIKVHVVTSEADQGNGSPEEEPDEEQEDEGEDEVVDEDDEEEDTVDVDVDFPTVSVGTNAHAAITAIAAYIWKNRKERGNGDRPGGVPPGDKPGITLAMIYEDVDIELTREQLKDALLHCIEQDVVMNVGEEGRGSENYYHLNQNGWYTLGQKGASDLVEEFPIEELLPRKTRGATAGFTYTDPDRGEYGREEPDVDEPVPINSPETHKHDALTILKRVAEEHGEDHWITAEGVYEYPARTTFANQTSASTCLSTLFLQHGLCERRKGSHDHGGVKCAYRLNKAGRGEMNRLGEANI